jgi:nucleoside-diphosphate-sugar epimerase
MVDVNGAGKYHTRPFPADRQAIDIGGYHADFSKIQAEFGWRPRRPLRDSIETTLRYYRDHLSHYV